MYIPFPPSCIKMSLRCPGLKHPEPTHLLSPLCAQIPPNTIQHTHTNPLFLVSPGPPCHPQPSWASQEQPGDSINIQEAPAHISLFQVSELPSHHPGFWLIISYQAFKTEFYFYCSDPAVLPDPSVEETWHLHYIAQISVLKRPHTKEPNGTYFY